VRTDKKRDRNVVFPERYVPADGSVLVDEKDGYLICGFTAKGNVAQPGERFYASTWSRMSTGTCSHGRHSECAHGAGGRHAAGVVLTDGDGREHVWRCGCDCHGYPYEPPPVPPIGQLELFAVAS
jgi:hypothetical protein